MNFGELFKRAIKYIVEGIVVALAAIVIPKRKWDVEEIVLVASYGNWRQEWTTLIYSNHLISFS